MLKRPRFFEVVANGERRLVRIRQVAMTLIATKAINYTFGSRLIELDDADDQIVKVLTRNEGIK